MIALVQSVECVVEVINEATPPYLLGLLSHASRDFIDTIFILALDFVMFEEIRPMVCVLCSKCAQKYFSI